MQALLSKKLQILVPVMLLFLPGCGGKETPAPVSGEKAAEYLDPASEFPKLVFADGQTSVNDMCPVRKGKLNRRMPAIYVNGRPVGFC